MPSRSAARHTAEPMRHLRPSDYHIMAWKNGGGTTTEIAIWPQDAVIGGAPFLWRASIADVISDGPFSRFPGYDRHIMVVAGNGMRLVCHGHDDIVLAADSGPRSFSGDWEIQGVLLDGPVRDFNLMVRRDHATSRLRVEQISGAVRLGGRNGSVIVHILAGELVVDGRLAGQSDTLILEPGGVMTAAALGEPTQVAVCEITPLAAASSA